MGVAGLIRLERTNVRKTVPAVIFDVDGTLVDSERHGHRVAFNAAFTQLGLPYHWDEEEYGRLLLITGGRRRVASFLEARGHPGEEAWALASAVHSRKTDLFVGMCRRGEIPARPGTVRLLDDLGDLRAPLGIATTGSRAWVAPLVDHLFGLDRFASVLTGDEVPDLKPSPAVYEAALERLDVTTGAVAVEDSRNGLVAAKAAGLPCVVVTNDYTSDQDFTEADLVVDSFVGTLTARTLLRVVETRRITT
jgi:HAD superfamily hydrolase (TIGR01509 family)